MRIEALEFPARFMARRLLHDLSKDEIRWLQRSLRGRTQSEWIAWRTRYSLKIADYLSRYPDQLLKSERRPDVGPVMKLAAWQLCLEFEVLFEQIRRRMTRKRRRP